MAKYTEAQKKSAEKYLSQFAEIRVRLLPHEKKEIEERARESGKSVNQYMKDKALSD